MNWPWMLFTMGCIALYCVGFIALMVWVISSYEERNSQ